MYSLIVTIILNYNGKRDTDNCLKSLNKITLPSNFKHEIVMVDNRSTDGSVEYLTSKYPKLKIISAPTNLGFTGGNNLGVDYARELSADWIMLLNNDTLVDHDLIKELYQSAQENPQAIIFSPKIYFAPGHEFHSSRYGKKDLGKVIWYAGGQIDWDNLIVSHRGIDEVDTGQYESQLSVQAATGCCMLISQKLWREQDLFDDKYFLYYEDTDLCLRAAKQGEILYVPRAKLWHINSGASGSGSHLHDYYLTRNRLVLGLRYSPLRTKVALIKESIRLYFHGRLYQKLGVSDFYLHRLGKAKYF